MRVLRHASLFFAALTIVATTASAQTQTSSPTPSPMPPEPEAVTLTPFIGAGFGGDLESAPVTFGVALGYGLTRHWSVEGDLYFQPDATEGQVVEFDTSIWALSANALYHFTGGQHLTPYLAGGLGFANANADIESTGLTDDDTSTKFVWNWGGGLKSALTDRYGLRADLRYFTGDELVPDHWRLYGGVVIRRLGQ